MPKRDIIVVGASSGGLNALRELVRGLPAGLPAAVLIVWHIAPESPNLLPELLGKIGPLNVTLARNDDPIRPGMIYVAPADRHLLVGAGRVRVTYGPKENRFRPAIDALFRSAAYVYGPRVIGVVLTGQLDDGTAGLWAIKDRGGLAIIQDRAEAEFPAMPTTARQYVDIDYELPLAEIGPALARLAAASVAALEALPMNPELEIETRIAENADSLDQGVFDLGTPSPYSCPECGGVLLQLKDGGIPRFRCHTGHAYSIHSLLSAVSEGIEREMWSTARAIEESALLLHQMAHHLREEHDQPSAELFHQKAHAAEQQVALLRGVLAGHDSLSANVLEQEARPKRPRRVAARKTARAARNGRKGRATRKTAVA